MSARGWKPGASDGARDKDGDDHREKRGDELPRHFDDVFSRNKNSSANVLLNLVWDEVIAVVGALICLKTRLAISVNM